MFMNMFGYEFSSIIAEKSTRNHETSYKLTSPLRVRVDFTGTGRSGYRLTINICGCV